MNLPLISIVIPVGKMFGQLKNLDKTLKLCTSKQIEIILVHDHFDNQTCEELDMLIKKNSSRILISKIETDSRGVGNARNIGLEAARGKWLGFVDSDDIANLDLYLNMVAQAEMENKSIAIGQYVKRSVNSDTGSQNFGKCDHLHLTLDKVSRNPGLWRWIFRKDRIGEVRFFNVPMAEDLLFLKMMNPLETEVTFFPNLIYNYVVGTPGQLTKDRKALSALSQSFNLAINLDKTKKFSGVFSQAMSTRIGLSALKRRPSFYVVKILFPLLLRSKFKHRRRND